MRWTDEDTSRLVYLREIKRLPWAKVAEAFPRRSQMSCEVRYWYIHTHMVDRGARFAPAPAPPCEPRQAMPSPRTRKPLSHSALLIDAELRARIEVVGITAGLLGDPLPGRSALDRKRPSTTAR